MKTLSFSHAGRFFECSLESATLGHVVRHGENEIFPLPHPSWKIVGFSRHHWARSYKPLTESTKAEDAEGSLVWDFDHGTLRRWGGRCDGKIPRARRAAVWQ
jgi:hypothetical protein